MNDDRTTTLNTLTEPEVVEEHAGEGTHDPPSSSVSLFANVSILTPRSANVG